MRRALDPPSLPRRHLLLGLLGLAASGCANTPLLNAYVDSLRGRGRHGTPAVTREAVDALPYATMGLTIGTGSTAMVVLEKTQGEDQYWVAADHLRIATRSGRLVMTDGLRRDLAGCRFSGTDPVAGGLQKITGSVAASWKLALAPGDFRAIECQSVFTATGAETISILGRPAETVRVTEAVSVPRWSWRNANTYWVDRETGFVWKSIQRCSPDMPSVQMEVYKRAA